MFDVVRILWNGMVDGFKEYWRVVTNKRSWERVLWIVTFLLDVIFYPLKLAVILCMAAINREKTLKIMKNITEFFEEEKRIGS